MVRGLLIAGVIALVVTVYAAVDCAIFPKPNIRGVSRASWIAIIVLLPVVGAVLWFTIGRGRRGKLSRTTAPDDDPDFLRSLRKQQPRPDEPTEPGTPAGG